MMSYKLPGLVCAASVAFIATAGAADLPPLDLPPMRSSAPYVQEFFSAWYVRLDGGYRSSSVSGGTAFGGAITTTKIDDTPTIGGGFGAKWNWLRGDITVDYGGQTKFTADTALGASAIMQRMQNFTTLVNGYLDLGTWYGFTPYVGVGAGYTYLKPTQLTQLGVPLPTTNNTWNFTWAAMAGATISLSQNLLLDMNYRYLDMGSTSTNSPNVGTVNYGGWTANEYRIGLRYLIQ